jgi:hypothetical protein
MMTTHFADGLSCAQVWHGLARKDKSTTYIVPLLSMVALVFEADGH